MKALRVHEHQKPPPLDDVPEPEVQGPWDVVDVSASTRSATIKG